MKKIKLIILFFYLLFLSGCSDFESANSKNSIDLDNDYPAYGGNKFGNRYSPLNQINKENVNNLEIAWMYDAAEGPNKGSGQKRARQIQCQPIVIEGVLYGTTPELKLFALDAGTGEELWKFDPLNDDINVSRGVVFWEKGDDKRILYTVGSKLYAVRAKNGNLVGDFGDNGIVSLHKGLSGHQDHDVMALSVRATSPGVVFKNTLIIGSSVSEGGDAAPGHIRAFDILTGDLKWVFHTIPHPGEIGYDTWPEEAYKELGGANSWSGIVLDEKRGVVYFGTGSPSSDFYGGNRKGENLFANCIMALDAETGKMEWYYQTIHHDLWDRDLPTPPNLTTIERNGREIDVVVQATKDGYVYVLDRDTGISIFPVEKGPVPTDGLPGEHPWPSQKYPIKPLPFSSQVFTEEDITNISQESHAFVKDIFRKLESGHKFTPPSTVGTILHGYSGGAEWGGNSIDPGGILYQNSNDDPWILQMENVEKRNDKMSSLSHGNALYLKNCAACHGQDRKGSGTDFPSLENIAAKLSQDEINSIMESGVGRMPSFQHISEHDRKAITAYLLDLKSENGPADHNEDLTQYENENEDGKKKFGFSPKYVIKVWKRLTDQNGYPGNKPPWGTLNAIDLNTGDYLWRVPLGEFPELTEKGIPITGTPNYGGPVVTAGGLVFIAGTKDERIRAFDKDTGKVVWEYQLPAGGFATPITYMVDGVQYVVIAAGGARGQKPGGNYIAFALEDKV